MDIPLSDEASITEHWPLEEFEVEEKVDQAPAPQKQIDSIPVCKCLKEELEKRDETPARKRRILSTVARTEEYLRARRIPELTRFLFTKLVADAPHKPAKYLEDLLNDCMLYRSGMTHPPVLYERRHLEAVVKSFDPSDRGWMTSGQIRRAFHTLGITPLQLTTEKVSTSLVLEDLERIQEKDLCHLLTAGTHTGNSSTSSFDGSDQTLSVD